MTTYRIGWLSAGVALVLVALLVLLVLVSNPSALRVYGRWMRSLPTPSAAQLETLARVLASSGVAYVGFPPEPDPSRLTDEELCQRWRASCLYVGRRPSAPNLMHAVEQRQAYLDEFERRYPGPFAAWLTSGAGALDYLTPYAMRGHVDHAAINWDELTRGRD